MKKTIEHTVIANEANIGRLAYQLWENAGRPNGQDLEFWLKAEEQVRAAATAGALVVNRDLASAVSTPGKASKNGSASRGMAKKTWPKPYPNLPKF